MAPHSLLKLPLKTFQAIRRELAFRMQRKGSLFSASRTIRKSGLFDTQWYLANNPDVASENIDPIHHYLIHGAYEGRSPHPLFDSAYYLNVNTDVAALRINPLLHFLRSRPGTWRSPHPLFDIGYYVGQLSTKERQALVNPLHHFLSTRAESSFDPHPLFSVTFYKENYPEIDFTSISPLVHFLTTGAKEGRNPHAIFDDHFYRLQAGDEIGDDSISLLHFISEGARKGFSPHAWFDVLYYTKRYRDIQESGVNPLWHYQIFGASELRDPCASFDAKYYYKHNSDAALAKTNPLLHFLTVGITQGRRPSANDAVGVPVVEAGWRKFIPLDKQTALSTSLFSSREPVSIVIPVYRGAEATKRCIKSVLSSSNKTPFKVILINDCSPESAITEFLSSLNDSRAIVYTNEENLGFVATVNKGMTIHPLSDIVLLNSDAEVTHGWLDKLISHAYCQQDVGTVTPFSNNATICSFPSLDGFRAYRGWETLEMIDTACENANRGRSVAIPTAVGFCMFIRRDCLNATGLFDAATFGKGYGEENDFCVRASAKGWKHLLACDTFVFHEGECSFQESSVPAKKVALDILRARHPHYDALITQHQTDNPAMPFRVAALSVLDAMNPLPTVLFISHSLGGGTEKHREELTDSLKGKIRAITLRPEIHDDKVGGFLLHLFDGDRGPNLLVPDLIGEEFLAHFLAKSGIQRIHIHHTIGSAYHLRRLVDRLAVPYDITIHDYFTVCPQVNMITPQANYCGEPTPDACTDCILQRPSWGSNDIHWWRLENKALIERAERVICPSEDVLRRMSRYIPLANYTVVSHEMLEATPKEVTYPPLAKGEPMRVAILGAVSLAKGSRTLIQLIKRVEERKLPIRFHVIGYIGRDGVDCIESEVLTYTGTYADDTLLAAIKDYDPHLILFPARWPETYSYTLSAALVHSTPIVAPRGGAFIERLEGRPLSSLYDMTASADDLLRVLIEMQDLLCDATAKSPTTTRIIGGRSPHPTPMLGKQSSFYATDYLEPLKHTSQPRTVDYRAFAKGNLSVLILPELNERGPTACSYIRLVLPLLAAHERGELSVHTVTVDSLLRSQADVLILNRVSIESPETVSKVLAYCRSNHIKVIYDIDDDLLQIEEHGESIRYTDRLPSVLRVLIGADQVWASTPTLASRLEGLTRECVVVPNGLDDQLWLSKIASPSKGSNKVIRLVYMGTRTHDSDFEMILPALELLHSRYGGAISLDIIGVVSRDDLIPSWANRIPISFKTSESYPRFVRWVRSQGRYDIGLAPLVQTHFNAAKSEIKLFDYAGLGACTVTSPHGGYATIGIDGINCLFAENTPEAWYEKLDALISDIAMRTRLQAGAQSLLSSAGLNSCHLATRLRTLKGVVTRVDASVVPQPIHLNNPAVDGNENSPIVLRLGKNRFRRILSHSFITGEGIEIGALQNPLPISETAKVRYVDRLSREDLYLHYPELRQYDLVDPDILDNGEDLSTLPEGSQDFVIANHFLEHCENTLRALRNFARVLRPGGRVFLALPDKRFTFDKNRKVTPLSHVLHDYAHGAEISRRSHFKEWASLVEPFFNRHYQPGEETEARTEQLMKEDYSIHFHCWTPREVHELLEHMVTTLRFPFEVEYFLSTEEEMIMILRRTNAPFSETVAPEALLSLRNESKTPHGSVAVGL